MKPCFICKQPSDLKYGALFFGAEAIFRAWADQNQIICPWRSRFDCVRDALKWAALDENNEGAHAGCALRWAVTKTGWAVRYPLTEVA